MLCIKIVKNWAPMFDWPLSERSLGLSGTRSLGLNGTRIYIDDKNVAKLITARIECIKGGRTSFATFRGYPLWLVLKMLSGPPLKWLRQATPFAIQSKSHLVCSQFYKWYHVSHVLRTSAFVPHNKLPSWRHYGFMAVTGCHKYS
jgi:hypothetical protein